MPNGRSDPYHLRLGSRDSAGLRPVTLRLFCVALVRLRNLGPVLVAAVAVSVLMARAVADTPKTVIESHGFHIDAHRISQRQLEAMLPSIGNQLAIVESVGLPPRVLAFMRSVPLVIDPALSGNPGFYTQERSRGVVLLQPIVFPDNKPILLHELLHAYHLQTLPLPTPEIRSAYEEALRTHMYPASFRSAHFLENPREYFAVIGTIFLFGQIQQPPYSCAIPAAQQPQFLAFLAAQFGPHECK
jgi:hypothetical protein